MKKLVINFSDRTFYTLIVLVTIVLVGGVIAYNSGDPTINGHSADEISGTLGTLTCTMVSSLYSGGGSVSLTATCPQGFLATGGSCYLGYDAPSGWNCKPSETSQAWSCSSSSGKCSQVYVKCCKLE